MCIGKAAARERAECVRAQQRHCKSALSQSRILFKERPGVHTTEVTEGRKEKKKRAIVAKSK